MSTNHSGGSKTYLDMANWIELAEGRVDRKPFERAIRRRRIVPVLSLSHLLELASNEDAVGRQKVTHYMDAIDSIGQVMWIKHYRDVMRLETIACFKEVYGANWQPPSVYCNSFHDTLPDLDAGTIMIVGEGMPRHISEIVEAVRDTDQFREYISDCLDYPDLRRFIVATRNRRGATKRFADAELLAWLARLLPDEVPMTIGPIAITRDIRDRFLERAVLDRCPAFRANWAFHEGANLAPEGASRSDIADLWHLPGAAYCDIAFVDKRTSEALRRGKYDRIPKRNSEFAGWLRSLP